MRERWWIILFVLAFLLAILSPMASRWLDGLDRVSEDQGFAQKAAGAPFSIIPDYAFPGIENEALATIAAGVVGAIVVLGVTLGVAALISRHAQKAS